MTNRSDIEVKKEQINENSIIHDFKEFLNFDEIVKKDYFFTSIKSQQSLHTVLLLAELYTEFSKEFKQVIYKN